MLFYLSHVSDGVGVIHQFSLVHFHLPQSAGAQTNTITFLLSFVRRKTVYNTKHLRIDGEQKFALMRAHPAGMHTLHETRMLVDQPGLAQHIGRGILQLWWSVGSWAKAKIQSTRIQSTISDDCTLLSDNIKHTRFVSCVSIMKLCTCFSALDSSSLRETTATSSAVQPAPCVQKDGVI